MNIVAFVFLTTPKAIKCLWYEHNIYSDRADEGANTVFAVTPVIDSSTLKVSYCFSNNNDDDGDDGDDGDDDDDGDDGDDDTGLVP